MLLIPSIPAAEGTMQDSHFHNHHHNDHSELHHIHKIVKSLSYHTHIFICFVPKLHFNHITSCYHRQYTLFDCLVYHCFLNLFDNYLVVFVSYTSLYVSHSCIYSLVFEV